MIFETALRQQLEAKPKLTSNEHRILNMLKGPDSKRKRRRLARMENHARAALDIDPARGVIDWSSIDWASVLKTVLAVLIKLLPLLIMI